METFIYFRDHLLSNSITSLQEETVLFSLQNVLIFTIRKKDGTKEQGREEEE